MIRPATVPALLLGGLAALVLPGCGDVQPLGTVPGTVIPPGQTISAQPPAAPVGLIAVLTAAAIEDIVTRATDSNVGTVAALTTIGTRTLNLDAVDGSGGDKFPDATGTFTISLNGEAIPSWPTGTSGTGSATVAATFVGAQSATYTDPVSGVAANVTAANTFTYVFQLDTTWTKDAGPTPAIMAMTVTAAVGSSATGTSLSANGTLSTGQVWSLTGARSLSMTLARTAGMSTTQNTSSVTAASADITVTINGADTSRFTRTGVDAISVTLASQTAYAGPISGLPTSALRIHSGPTRY